MKRVIIMQGISGSGKTVFARRLTKNVPGAVIISADDFLMDGDRYMYDNERVKSAHSYCFHAFIEAVHQEAPLIIIDNTNLKWNHVWRYARVAPKYGYDVSVERVECDPIIAAFRTIHNVPASTIRWMAAKLAAFCVPKGFNVPIHRHQG
jgi:predicted kinase